MAKFATVGIFLFIPLVLCTSISTSKVGDSDSGGGGGGGDPHSRPGSRARVAKRNISDRSSQNMTRWPTNYAMVSNHTNPGVYFELSVKNFLLQTVFIYININVIDPT